MKNSRRILVVNAHPDGGNGHLCDALAASYADSATAAGHEVERTDLARLDVPLLASQEQYEGGEVPITLKTGIDHLVWCDHIVLVFPLWLGTMPALLKAWLEQAFRPGVAFDYLPEGRGTTKLFGGKTARIIVTMGMPALIYRLWFRSHGVAGLRRSILKFSGMKTVEVTYFGKVEQVGPGTLLNWLTIARQMGARAA